MKNSKTPRANTFAGARHRAGSTSIAFASGKAGAAARHRWSKSDAEAYQFEQLKQNKSLEAVRWSDAVERCVELFCEGKMHRTEKYLVVIQYTVRTFVRDCGNLIVEDTSLRTFSNWVFDRAQATSGRTANRDRQQLICIARSLRQRAVTRTSHLSTL